MTSHPPLNQILLGDCVALMDALPEKCVDLVFADPPYNMQLGGELWRPDMTKVDAVTDSWDKFGSFAEYDTFTRAWLTAARRVLKDTGTLWVIGSYHNIYRVGTILQDLGFWILNDVAWVKCLAETTRVCVRTAQGVQSMALCDVIRQLPEDVQLWNGTVWTQVCGWTTVTADTGLELILRSGERLECTPEHRWPTKRGLVSARDLRVGDVLQTCALPEPDRACSLNRALTGAYAGVSGATMIRPREYSVSISDVLGAEIVRIQPAATKHFVDIAVADEPHLFALASGILTHNSNPMPQMKGVRFCNAHETLLWAKKTPRQSKYTFHYRELKAGNDDKQMRSDWYLPICTGGEREKLNGHKAHATQKPESLLHRIIAATSNPGDLVLDPFCGTGTTAAVSKRLGRNYITIDRVETYVGVAEKRLANVSPALIQDDGVFVDAPKPRVPFLSLVEAGRLSAGTLLRLKGTEMEGVVHEDGTISAGGHKGSIHKVGALCLNLPTCNGWIVWRFRDAATGEERLIDTLRYAFDS